MRLLRPTFTAGLALATALAIPGVGNAATITPEQAADYGAGYLGRLMDPTDYVPALSGANYSETALAVLALVAAGVGEAQAAEATEFLFDNVDAYVVQGGADNPGNLAQLIMVGHARGLDTSALVTRLLATKRTTGPDAGLFGAGDATYDGAYRQALGLLALAAVGQTDADAVAWLVAEQCPDGGWMGNNPDQDAASCPAFDFETFVGEDTNGTALATQALDALGVTPGFDARDFLAAAQKDDGGFGFVPGFDSDANSTALAIQALLALGEDLGDWSAPDGTPYAFLLSLQLPNPPAKTAGAFAFQPGTGGSLTANVFATVQAVPALAGDPYPIAPRTLVNTLPLLPTQVAPTTPPATPGPTTPPPVLPSEVPVTPPAPVPAPTRVVNAAPVPELPATGSIGEKPWDANGQVVFGLGLIGYGVLALAAARFMTRRRDGLAG
ncbi:MAG TPA: hypothetical protein VNA20_01785 [Frankiaceae bacterium]|nr:hypothetical protein [Frankiaceae bacterium]